MNSEIKPRFSQALKWSTLNATGINVFQIIISIVLARLLLPKDFGIVAIITVFTSFLRIFIDSGLGAFIIYKDDIDQFDLSSIFWLNVFLGILISTVLLSLAPFISAFYNEPVLNSIAFVSAANFIISSITIVQLALLRKHRNFKSIFLAQFFALTISATLAIFLALKGFGVWCLVARDFINAIAFTTIIWCLTKWRPNFFFSTARIKQAVSYSLPLFVSNLLAYGTKDIDYLIVGKVLGTNNLGYYQKAFQFSSLPGNQIVDIIGFLMFANFARNKTNKDEIWNQFITISKIVCFLSITAGLIIFFSANSFVMKILGSRWEPSVTIFQSFFFLVVFLPLYRLQGTIFYSLNSTKIEMLSSIILVPLYLLIIPVAQYGPNAIAVYMGCIILFMFLLRGYFTSRLLNRNIFEYLFVLKSVLCTGLIVFICMLSLSIQDFDKLIYLFIVPCSVVLMMASIHFVLFNNESKEILLTLYLRLKAGK
jgi:teichuronic acid exporter